MENPYWQYFCREVYFQHQWPFDPTELIKFRKRMGERGMEHILKVSIDLFNRKEVQEKHVLIDTTVQEKNITFPTDTKLQKKIIEKIRDIAEKEGIVLRQSYTRTMKQLMIDQRFRDHPKRRKKANAAARKIKIIAGRLVRDLERKMTGEQLIKYEHDLLLFHRVLNQQQKDSNKIYSLHEPDVLCITKGKEAKKYEFGNKVSIVKTMKSGIIVGACSFRENLYDADTLDPQLQQVKRLTGKYPDNSHL
jgi:IS5 family transposase